MHIKGGHNKFKKIFVLLICLFRYTCWVPRIYIIMYTDHFDIVHHIDWKHALKPSRAIQLFHLSYLSVLVGTVTVPYESRKGHICCDACGWIEREEVIIHNIACMCMHILLYNCS